MANTNEEIQQEITDKILTGGSRTLAISFRSILNKILNSFPNFKNGGKSFEVEVGYKDAFRPSSAGAFATVDMLGSADLSDYYTKTEIDSFVVVQKEYTNPLLVAVVGVATWTITNELSDKYVNVTLYTESDNRIYITGNLVVTESTITITFGADVPANTYRCSVQGVQKTPGPPPEGFTYTFPFTLS